MSEATPTFESLGLNEHLLKALNSVGYEQPSPIQAQSIPPLLAGRDILGQAQTGTGKTAAFALPILQSIDCRKKTPQVLVLAPTRELAIQVAEAFQRYAHNIPGFHVLPIYGGQGYESQIKALRRGVQVIVGTPGRVMDHMRKGTLKLESLTHLVLDEADEMLRMGFIDDVEWVLGQIPAKRQIALFSATMPKEIAKVANTYLKDPVHIKIKVSTTTAATIRQRYWPVGGVQKLDALTRILEAEPFDAMIIFVRTKTATVELAEKLEARGYRAAPLNGDISQNLRERTVSRLKSGKVDLLVATDVAARGLDVDRISHVFNYDIPYDTEAYVHRIGRTGRAGRTGEAILFVARREMRMLRAIEKATNQPIEAMSLPSASDINQKRVENFKQKIKDTIAEGDLDFFSALISEFQKENEADLLHIGAALAKLYQGDQPLILRDQPAREKFDRKSERGDSERFSKDRGSKHHGDKDRDDKHFADKDGRKKVKTRDGRGRDFAKDTYRIEVGRNDEVTPRNIVGAIANEAGIDSKHIGQIKIREDYSTVELPSGMPRETLHALKKAWVCQKQLNISLSAEVAEADDKPPKKKTFDKKKKSKAKQKA